MAEPSGRSATSAPGGKEDPFSTFHAEALPSQSIPPPQSSDSEALEPLPLSSTAKVGLLTLNPAGYLCLRAPVS
jgi:hypothetical protein